MQVKAFACMLHIVFWHFRPYILQHFENVFTLFHWFLLCMLQHVYNLHRVQASLEDS